MQQFDLHTHTCFSDGSYTPQQLLEEAKKSSLAGLSITDHDTVEAYFHLPLTDLKIGIGVEFSSFMDQESVHILGYDFILDHPAIAQLCQRHKDRRLNRNRGILHKLQQLGIKLTESELYSRYQERSVGRPHIAQFLVDWGVCTSIEQAFKDYLADGKKAYVAGEMISSQETIEVIHQAEGKAFIAHPHVIKSSKLLRDLKQLPFDGIEVYYARYSKEEIACWLRLAQEKNWLISGGSDFHGAFKTFNHLGSSWVDEMHFNQIFSHPI